MRTVKVSLIVVALVGAGCIDPGALEQLLSGFGSAVGVGGTDQNVGDVSNLPPDGSDGDGQPIPRAGVMQIRVRNESPRAADVTIRFLLNNILVHLAQLNSRPATTTAVTGPDVAQVIEVSGADETGFDLPPATFVFEEGAENSFLYVIFECRLDADCDDGAFCNGAERCVEGSCAAGTAPCPPNHCDEVADECLLCVDDAECDDGLFCTGTEQCVNNQCQPGINPCGELICLEDADACVVCTVDADCDDGLFCNGAETCVDFACQPGADPCPDQECDETADQCVVEPQITDCNRNGIDDTDDIREGTSRDCNRNGRPDECEDCNDNGTPDRCEVACHSAACARCIDRGDLESCAGDYVGVYVGDFGVGGDVQGALDIQGNLYLSFPTATGEEYFSEIVPADVDTNGTVTGQTECALIDGLFAFDTCSAEGSWEDLCGKPIGSWSIERQCAADCNLNLIPDECDIDSGRSEDRNGNGIPDECEDCNTNGVMDTLDIDTGASEDCNANWIPDECDLESELSQDLDENGVPDECEDCNTNGLPDACDLDCGAAPGCDAFGCGESFDCNTNGVPDECDIAAGTSLDADTNGLPDECIALYAVERNTSRLWLLDPETGDLQFVADMLPDVSGATGLAAAPDGTLYAIIDTTTDGFHLATVDLPSGAVTFIGDRIFWAISDIAFGPGGTLYGILGGAGEPQSGTIVMIRLDTAEASTNGVFGAEGGAQSIANRPGANSLFHASCSDFGGGPCQIEVIDNVDVPPGDVRPLAAIEDPYQALTFDVRRGRLLGASSPISGGRGSISVEINAIDPATGAETPLSTALSSTPITGMAFGPGPFPPPIP